MTQFEVRLENGTIITFSADEDLRTIGERFTNHQFVQVGQEALIQTSKVCYVAIKKEKSE